MAKYGMLIHVALAVPVQTRVTSFSDIGNTQTIQKMSPILHPILVRKLSLLLLGELGEL